MKNIILVQKEGKTEAWGSFSEVCKLRGWNYHQLRQKKMPVEVDGFKISRVPFKKQTIIL